MIIAVSRFVLCIWHAYSTWAKREKKTPFLNIPRDERELSYPESPVMGFSVAVYSFTIVKIAD